MAASEPTPDPGLRRPAGCADLFFTFNRLALQGFGGVLPVAHHALVERERWLDLTIAYQQQAAHPAVAGALRGMGAVAAGLIVATAVKLVPTLRHNPLGVPISMVLGLAAFALVGVLRWPMVWVVLSLGGLGMTLAWRRLRAAQPPP